MWGPVFSIPKNKLSSSWSQIQIGITVTRHISCVVLPRLRPLHLVLAISTMLPSAKAKETRCSSSRISIPHLTDKEAIDALEKSNWKLEEAVSKSIHWLKKDEDGMERDPSPVHNDKKKLKTANTIPLEARTLFLFVNNQAIIDNSRPMVKVLKWRLDQPVRLTGIGWYYWYHWRRQWSAQSL